MAATVPTFKLVLVGDGGTGKVSKIWFHRVQRLYVPYPLTLKTVTPLLAVTLG